MAIIVRALGQTPTQAQIEEMKAQADPEGTGVVDFPEFLAVFANNQREPVTEDELRKAFEHLDESKKGIITNKSLQHSMSTQGETMTQEEIDNMIYYANQDAEGNINYRDFIRLLMSK